MGGKEEEAVGTHQWDLNGVTFRSVEADMCPCRVSTHNVKGCVGIGCVGTHRLRRDKRLNNVGAKPHSCLNGNATISVDTVMVIARTLHGSSSTIRTTKPLGAREGMVIQKEVSVRGDTNVGTKITLPTKARSPMNQPNMMDIRKEGTGGDSWHRSWNGQVQKGVWRTEVNRRSVAVVKPPVSK